MLKSTHIAFAIALGAFSTKFINIPIDQTGELTLYGSGLVLGSLIPDIDHPNSAVSRKVPIVPGIISSLFGHRTFFHSLLFVALVAAGLFSFIPFMLYLGFLIGIVSHLIGDMMTVRGIKLFYPFGDFISFPIVFKTGGIVEYTLLVVFGLIAALWGYKLII